jgi:transposase InsO family protein
MEMPWKEATTMSERSAFIEQAKQEGANLSALCKEYGISRVTGYKWLRRYAEAGEQGLGDRTRRPHRSPSRTADKVESAILEVRSDHPGWGGVKILAYLKRKGWQDLPSASTATAILQRNGKMDPQEACKHRPMQRFEWAAPNDLWQMDFKGHFRLEQGRCHPLTVLDDYSRFLLGLYACPNEIWQTVQAQLTQVFRQYGLPNRMLMDNGSPWGDDRQSPHTILTAWLMRLDVAVSHGRPYHPQTQGKDERLHRTFQAELLDQVSLQSLPDCQAQFDRWRRFYNYERPHQALGQAVPAERYQASSRPFPEILPPIVYNPDDIVRMVDLSGKISYHSRSFRISKAFRYSPVALRPTVEDGVFDVFFCRFKVAQISLQEHNC